MGKSQNGAGRSRSGARTDQTAHAALHIEAMDTTEGLADIPASIQPSVRGAEATQQRSAPRRSPSSCTRFRAAHGLGTGVVSDSISGANSPRTRTGFRVRSSYWKRGTAVATPAYATANMDFSWPNQGSTVESERTDCIDQSHASRTAPSRPVQQAARTRATSRIPENTRSRCPPAPTLAEIRSHLTEIRESTLLPEAVVAAAPAASTREVISSASLAESSAPETGVDPGEEAATSVATIDQRARSPACAPADSTLPSVAATGCRQGRRKDKERVVRFKHVTYCCICEFWTRDAQEVTPTDVEAVFCGTCPRKFCLSCLNLFQTPDTLGWEACFDNCGEFRRMPGGCTYCRRGADREVPVDVGEPHCTAIMEALKGMLQWLGEHDLALMFLQDVDTTKEPTYKRRIKKPMSLAKIRDQLNQGYYAVMTEAGVKSFLQDLALIESNCIRFNGKEPGISRSATTLLRRAHLFYQSHIEPLAAKLGFPHMLGENYTCNERIWVGGSTNAADRSSGDQAASIDGAMGGGGNRASPRPSRASATPPTSSSPNSAESYYRVSTPPYSHAPSAGTLPSSIGVSGRGTSAESRRDIGPSADPVTEANGQASVNARNTHILLCYICGRSPGSQDESNEEEVVLCRECPRKACLSCHFIPCSTTKQPTGNRGRWERGRDHFGVFWLIPRCRKCLFKAESKFDGCVLHCAFTAASINVVSIERCDNEVTHAQKSHVPVELDVPSSDTPAQDLHEYVLEILWNFLDRRNLAQKQTNNVARYPMNLTQMLKHLDDGVYELNRGGPDLFIQDLCLTLHDCRASNVAVQDDIVAYRCARIILAHGEHIIPVHGEKRTAGTEPPRTRSRKSEMNGIRDRCHHLGSRASGNCSGGVSRDSAASSDHVHDTRFRARLRLKPNGCVHTKPGESTSVREPTGAGIRREELAEQLDNDNRPRHESFNMRETELTLSSLNLQQAEAPSTAVRQQAGASAAAEIVERPTTPEISTAALTAGSTKLNQHFETEWRQSGTAVRKRFLTGHVVWVFHWFGADMPTDGWVGEEMHVPGVIRVRDEAVGTSPAMFTIDLFGRQPIVLYVMADKLSLFPTEGDLDSAQSAVTHGLRPEKGGGINYLNMAVAQAMMTCIDSGWNSTTGTNIYHKHASPGDSETGRRTKEYGEAWGVDSVKLAGLMRHLLQVTGRQETTADSDCSGRGSRVLGVGGGDGIGAADSSAGGSGGDGSNCADGIKSGGGAAAGAADDVAWTPTGSHTSPARSSASQHPSTTRPSALQASADGMPVDAGFKCDNSIVPTSAAEEKTGPGAQSSPSNGAATRIPTVERIELQRRRSCYETPPTFNARDFENRSINPSGSNQAILPKRRSLSGR